MANRTLSFNPFRTLKFLDAWESGVRTESVTDAEVADLLARVLEAAGHELPDESSWDNSGAPEMYRDYLLTELARWRAALARDAEKAEREQAVEAKAKDLHAEYRSITGQWEWHHLPVDVTDGWRAVARKVLEVTA